MPIHPYLSFNGNCREAVEFYAEVFETETQKIMTMGEIPPSPDYPLPDEAKNLVMHTQLKIDGTSVMFSDTFPGMPYNQGSNITLAFVNKNTDQIKSCFYKLQEGGRIDMELQESSWSRLYGQVTDKFGISWQFNYDG
ncbi:VOC family protein [Jeotgalibacillus sp. S-D1]|uniref:VOC family protein n=1 Tax=Jeotgalibacillus sp. S-D1 TaxID=2552189 RepID=UPI00105A9583|nr:VOC family protein [Jeotgalibacillus sp. S-D1]TDL34211.1 VOC family protein [Jeotgalibacillus sp. S-D1]